MSQLTIFKWPIVKFSTVASRENPNAILNSDDFTLGDSQFTFYLQFEPTNRKDDSKTHSSLYLMSKNLNGESKVEIQFKFWIENNCGQMIRDKTNGTSNAFEKINQGWGFSQFIHHDKLYSNNSVKDDFIFICCEIERLAEKPKMPESDLSLRASQYSLYKQGIVGSCTIKIGRNHEFQVAKNVLMSESEVFHNMLSSDMEEAKTNVIQINGVRPSIMSAFIDYLHLHRLENLDLIAQELFEVADCYSVKSLVDECVESMSKSFNKSNILKRLQLAFMHSNEKLKRHTLDYVTDSSKDGNFRQIIKTSAWKKLLNKNEKLAYEIMDAVFDKTYWLS